MTIVIEELLVGRVNVFGRYWRMDDAAEFTYLSLFVFFILKQSALCLHARFLLAVKKFNLGGGATHPPVFQYEF